MQQKAIHSELLVLLAGNYERNPLHFVTLPKEAVDSSFMRVALAELRNEGFLEEQMRGVVRLTARGYKASKSVSISAA
jgi:hypothetical protein